MPETSVLGRLRQEDGEFETSLGCIAGICFNNKNKKRKSDGFTLYQIPTLGSSNHGDGKQCHMVQCSSVKGGKAEGQKSNLEYIFFF
jgi:hypothetical protein